MSSTSVDEFTLDAIDRDVQFVGRLVGSTQIRSVKRAAGIAMLAIAPYMALFIHESLPKVRSLRPELLIDLPDDLQEVVKRSRHSLKLFEDSKRSLDDQLTYFSDVLLSVHKKQFLGNTWLRPARIFETDLGVFRWGDGSYLGTTHGISMSMGLELDEMVSGSKDRIQEVSVGYGKYFGLLGAKLESGASSFVTGMASHPVRNLDRKSWKLYEAIFPGIDDPPLTGLLLNLACSIDFVHDLLPLDKNEDSRHTTLKIRFLTLYQVVRSLDILLSNGRLESVSDAWVSTARRMIRRSEVAAMVSEESRPFRNTLMHYGPDSRMDVSKMQIGVPLYGMTELCFDGKSVADFESDLTYALGVVQSLFRETRGRRRI